MEKEISEHVIRIMNLGEKRYEKPEMKQAFVICSIQLLLAISEEELKDLIEVFIKVSKLTTKMLFNETENANCCEISWKL